MAHAEDPHRSFVQTEQNAIISDPQTEGTMHAGVKGRDITGACCGVMRDALENA